jgi:uroporphyrinogen-III decarboxylase
MDDWLRLKPHYEFSEKRFGKDWGRTAREHRAAGRAVRVGIPGGFAEPRNLMGDAAVCIAYYEQPELMHDILDTIADTACRVLDRVSKTVPVDILNVHEDLAGKNGPLCGPKQVREFIGPYYRRVWEMLHDRGARLFEQDSDGNVEAVLPAFLEAGLNETHPCEPAAGMDIVKLREQYGTRLAFMGGIDKHVIRRSQDEIVAELEYKVPPLVATGGCVFSLDHRIPNGTPIENYRFYVAQMWEILNREAAKL